MQILGRKKTAFVHDYLLSNGGAERTLGSIHELLPESPIYTFLYDEKKMGGQFAPEQVVTSFLQKFPGFLRRNHKYLAPLLPVAAESLDLRDYDLVISSSSAFAKGVITRSRTVHVSYCHSPMRYAWDFAHEYQKDTREKTDHRVSVMLLQHYLRIWDRSSSDRVTHFIANSKTVAGRIRKYYRRESEVIYPPVETQRFSVRGKDDGYFLVLSRLAPYKKADLAVKAFNKLQLPLVIAGSGPEEAGLKEIAGKNVTFLGEVSEEKKKELLEHCIALVFPGEDDFGITPVEAMACGKPVLAFRRGGTTETIPEGVCGEFFDDPAAASLADGVRRVLEKIRTYDRMVIRRRAEEFDKSIFLSKMAAFLEKAIS
jgi:glycosyltransferase involved in cell wall biosynthesis